MPTSSSGDLRDAGSRKLAGFLCKRNVQYLGNDSKDVSHILEFRSHDRHQDQILQEGHKIEHVVEREVPGSGVNGVARCESASGINARRIDKGKEKVIYNNNNCVSNTKESDDSNESIESCPSMKAPKRKHVECSAANMSSRNKKCRREDNESACSGILEKCGSSFFNWMSSLTKGLITLDETTPAVLDQTCVATKVEESAAPPLPLQSSSGIPVQSLGFNSLFQSLYNHNVMVTSRTGSFVISESSHDELEIVQDTHKSSSGNGKIVLWMGDRGKEPLCIGSNEESKGTFVSERVHQHGGASTAGKSVSPHDILKTNPLGEYVDTKRAEMKEGTSDFMASPPNSKQIVPYGIASNDLVDESSVVCGALQRLRLSRSDIIRWLRSPIMHTRLDGFFVRLRFGKWEEALGGTGYHVARLNGALDRNRLSVTIRNSTCQVDSRFVSNHDFHEDELKAWWSAAMKGDWKLPSKQELDMKFRERELLHW
ncbi:hypothetical protein PR202_gb29754 [Eleusine coracana subsp. coracana]|uniref:Plus3 domain-containing protein n=1 Tax=Eleusine coracana subsp. coracana TaxID=191504 RepID=A0AAV5FXV2_ELECO|nr:hypothetical protein PR202_gb29754 [Eleusine coracana subsp. coracana]